MPKVIILNLLLILFLVTLMFTNYQQKIIFPDLILILTVFNGFFNGPLFAMIFGFFSGFAYDLSYYPLLGFYALIYTVIGYSTSISKIIYINNSLIATVLIVIFFLLKSLLYLILGFFFLGTDYLVSYFKPSYYFVELFVTILISIPFFLIYRYFNSKSRKRSINV